MKPLNPTVAARPATVFDVMSRLAVETGAVNLGQGFPDTDGPEDMRAAAAQATLDGPNQYPPIMGLPVFRQAIAEADRRFWGLAFDWRDQVIVTSGATEALAAAAMAFLAPGDEVILIEPAYDAYFAMVETAGATVRPVRLAPPDDGEDAWRLDEAALRAAFGPATKAIFVNSPLNPVGKVFDRAELELIAALCREHDVIAICDEVYEHMVFDGAAHIPLIALPGMAERTVRISSAGKTFSLTGWKVGWATGPQPLIRAMYQAHQFLTATTPPNLQIAVAGGLAKPDSYFRDFAAQMQAKRDRLADGLAAAGFRVLPCAGTYFLTADTAPLGGGDDDAKFCMTLTKEAGVAAIPISAFYGRTSEKPGNLIRFCFAKQDALLDEAASRLRAWSGA